MVIFFTAPVGNKHSSKLDHLVKVCAIFLHCKVTLYTCNEQIKKKKQTSPMGVILWKCMNFLFPCKISPNGFSIHWWSLHESVTTVVTAKRCYFIILMERTLLSLLRYLYNNSLDSHSFFIFVFLVNVL